MDVFSVANAAYIVAALLFILSLAGLSKHESAKSGLTYGIAGMGVALAATVALVFKSSYDTSILLTLVAIVVGAAIGLWRARIVEMTGMPELIAALHSFVGLAAVLIGVNGHLEGAHLSEVSKLSDIPTLINIH